MNEFEILKTNFNMVKNDLKNQNVDLYVAKIELQTIVLKMTNLIKSANSQEMIDFLYTARKLLDEVSYNITALTAQEYFDSHNANI